MNGTDACYTSDENEVGESPKRGGANRYSLRPVKRRPVKSRKRRRKSSDSQLSSSDRLAEDMVVWQSVETEVSQPLEIQVTDLKYSAVDEEQRSLHVQRALIADEDGDRPIHISVVHGDIMLVKWLCILMKSVGASLDISNYLRQTPLHLAVLVENPRLIEVLMEEGATVQPRDRHGNTVLHLAVQYFNKECLACILRNYRCHAILDAHNYDGYSALHMAVFNQNASAVSMLIKSGCNINVQDGKSGRTPLMHAVLSKSDDMVCLLRKHGACSYKTDYSGTHPLSVATENGNTVMIAVLESGHRRRATGNNRKSLDR